MINFASPDAEIYFPAEGKTELSKTTHLGIGAHQDDLEVIAIHGILEAYDDQNKHFTGVTITDGRGAPRSGPFADMKDDDLWKIRVEEQKKAASIGKYLAQVLLNYSSNSVKKTSRGKVIEDLKKILIATNPEVIYTHNLADKHDTHVAVALSVIEAIRDLGQPHQNVEVYGCEAWRGLDWLMDRDKIAMDTSRHTDLQETLIRVFESQIAGGKRYDLATMGRRQANATFYQSHKIDTASLMVYAMDLTPLIRNPLMEVDRYVNGHIQSLEKDVTERIKRLSFM